MAVRSAALSSQRWRRLIPIAFITYSFAYLDRSNYSISAAGGLDTRLHITSAQSGFLGGMQTFLITMTNFTGTIRIDGSFATAPVDDEFSSDWTQIDSASYVNSNTPAVFNEVGSFLWLRIVVIGLTSGNPVAVTYKR